MRDLIITQNITLDGVIDAAGDWFEVGNDADLDDVAETLREHSAASDALLVGRSTFESFRSFWPQQTDDETGVQRAPQPRAQVRRLEHAHRPRLGAGHGPGPRRRSRR